MSEQFIDLQQEHSKEGGESSCLKKNQKDQEAAYLEALLFANFCL